jgi:hypothetical protein
MQSRRIGWPATDMSGRIRLAKARIDWRLAGKGNDMRVKGFHVKSSPSVFLSKIIVIR